MIEPKFSTLLQKFVLPIFSGGLLAMSGCSETSGTSGEDNTSCTDGNCDTDGTAQDSVAQKPCNVNEDCNDWNICTDERCEDGLCVFTNNDSICDDGDGCTENDRCSEGVCIGGELSCDDSNECTKDSCLEGACVHEYLSTTCDDGDDCTVDDVCVDGACVSGAPIECDDGNICTNEVCVDGVCEVENNSEACDDGDACTIDDVCVDGVCSGGLGTCDDDNPCTDDACDEGGCTHTDNTAPCDDGDGCTVDDTCTEGVCMAGSPMTCDDGDVCTVDACDDGTCVYTDNGTCSETDETAEESDTADTGISDTDTTGNDPGPCTPETLIYQMGVDGFTGVTDIGITEEYPDMTENDPEIRISQSNAFRMPDNEMQLLIEFDGVYGDNDDQIPPGSTIEEATFSLYTEDGTMSTISIHRLLTPWNTSATWNSVTNGIEADGVEAVATSDDEVSAPNDGEWAEFDVTASLTAWVIAPDSNHGFVLFSDGDDGWGVYTSEHNAAAQRPKLTVDICRPGAAADRPAATDTDTPTDTAENTPTNTNNGAQGNVNEPQFNAPQNNATGVGGATTLDVTVSTVNGDPLDVTFYGRKIGGETWTLIALPDTQHYSDSHPEIFISQTEWIVENREALNIQMVVHEGDLVNDGSDPDEWDNAYDAMNLLFLAQIPVTFSTGNHDHVGLMSTDGNTDLFSATFPADDFNDLSWWGGDYNGNTSHYVTLTISGEDYIFVGLDYCPDSDEIDWANSVLSAHPDRKAVLTTHALLDENGDYDTHFCGSTLYIFNGLIRNHSNLQLVLCGHSHIADSEGEAYVEGINNADKKVHQMMANYQGRTNGGNGLLRILTFDPPNDKIYVQTYSPFTGDYETDANSQFELDYEMEGSGSEAFSQIGSATGVGSNMDATLTYGNLDPNTTYEWHVVVTDGNEEVTSPTWQFTTAGS